MLMKVISNSTPIISLSAINQIELFKNLFTEIIIPRAVYREIKAKKSYGYLEIDLGFFKIMDIKGNQYLDLLQTDLGSGEAECIILAKEIQSDILIIDEKIGYNFAKNRGIFCLRTLSILELAKRKNFISELKPHMDLMIKKGRWYSNKVYIDFLKRNDEME
jgi:uncharacterized protein